MKLNFKIKHLMYLTLWTALVLWVKEPLLDTAPDLVRLVFWLAALAAVALFVALYGIALLADEGVFKDRPYQQDVLCSDR